MINVYKKIRRIVNHYSIKMFILATILISPMMLFADNHPDKGTAHGPEVTGTATGPNQEFAQLKNPLAGTVDSIPGLIKEILDIVVYIGVPIVAIMIIVSGLRLVMANGNPEKLTKAKEGILWTLVGAAVVLGAYGLATAIGSTVQDLTDI